MASPIAGLLQRTDGLQLRSEVEFDQNFLLINKIISSTHSFSMGSPARLLFCGFSFSAAAAILDIPRGWRSWNAFGINVNQGLMEQVTEALASRNLTIWNGSTVSLADLGYTDVGIDDGWQLAKAGINGGFHDAAGAPIVNTSKFPDLASWVSAVHALNMTAGFYGNNCMCSLQSVYSTCTR
jgi:hypothetical protein